MGNYISELPNEETYFKSRNGNKNRRLKFSNDFYVYDIESTKYESLEYPIMAYSYLHGIKKYTFSEDLTKDTLYKYASDYLALRYNDEVWDYFYKINLKAVERNEKVLILVHNLTYEFYNAIFNMPKLHKYLTENNNNIFAMSSTDILYVKIGNLEFRDTLKLFNKSLKLCAINVGMKKNEENKTYNEIWTPESDLPDWEYSYNESDLDITAVYFAKFVRLLNLEDKTINGFVKTKILTSTGMVKWVCSKINSKEELKNQMLMVSNCQKSITAEQQQWIEKDVFRGGFCKSIAYRTFCINKNVHSIDFASSYPAIMVTASFPKGEMIKSNGLITELYERIKDYSDEDYIENYFNESVYKPENHFIFKIKITDVELKERPRHNDVPYIAKDKCDNIINGLICNGSIYHADSLEVSGTELDLIIMCMFYNFKIDTIIEEYTFKKDGYLRDYKILSISRFAVEKEGFKKLSNCENIDEFNQLCKKNLYEDITYGDVWKSTGLDANKEKFNKVIDTAYTYLMNAKAKLNALYGISVQHQFQQNITYNDYGFNAENEKELCWNKKELYIQGIYVTAHARYRLLLMALKVSYDGINLIYFDTDSIKCNGNIEILNKNIKQWNDILTCLRDKIIRMYKRKKEKIFLSNFGNFDYEGTSEYFMTQGSKRYITINKGKVKCTISGVNKKRTSEALTIYYKKFGIDGIFKDWFGLNTLYDYNLALRSINYVPDEPLLISDKIIDDNGDECVVNQYSCEGISEKDCGYLLAGFESVINNNFFWYNFCGFIRKDGVKINVKPHTIKLINMKFDDEDLIDCDFVIEDGYSINKYIERMIKFYKHLIKEDITQDFNDELYEATHNFSSGFKLI